MLDLSTEISQLEEDISYYRGQKLISKDKIGDSIQEQVESIPFIGIIIKEFTIR